jgi:hypothetical protein
LSIQFIPFSPQNNASQLVTTQSLEINFKAKSQSRLKPAKLSLYSRRGNKLSGKSFAERNFCLKNFSNEEGEQEKDFAHPT